MIPDSRAPVNRNRRVHRPSAKLRIGCRLRDALPMLAPHGSQRSEIEPSHGGQGILEMLQIHAQRSSALSFYIDLESHLLPQIQGNCMGINDINIWFSSVLQPRRLLQEQRLAPKLLAARSPPNGRPTVHASKAAPLTRLLQAPIAPHPIAWDSTNLGKHCYW